MNLLLADVCFFIADHLTPIPYENHGPVDMDEMERYGQHNYQMIVASEEFTVAGLDFALGDWIDGFKGLANGFRELFY